MQGEVFPFTQFLCSVLVGGEDKGGGAETRGQDRGEQAPGGSKSVRDRHSNHHLHFLETHHVLGTVLKFS